MRILLDTEVFRELRRPGANKDVWEAVKVLPPKEIFVSVVTLGSIEKGVLWLSDEFKKKRMRRWMEKLRGKLGANILGVDYETAILWGRLMADADRKGLILPAAEAMIAATAKRHSLKLMTCNIGYYTPTGVQIYNPWGKEKGILF